MRKVFFAINMTADGHFSHTDGIADDQLHEYFTRLLRNTGVLLYGRVTYELMVPFWPDAARTQSFDPATNEFARVFDSLDKVLFSRTVKKVEDKHTRLATASLADEVAALKKQPGKDIGAGSLTIASQLFELGLIDEYRVVVHPVVAGKGPRLFDAVKLKQSIAFELVGSEPFSSGAVALHYKKRA